MSMITRKGTVYRKGRAGCRPYSSVRRPYSTGSQRAHGVALSSFPPTLPTLPSTTSTNSQRVREVMSPTTLHNGQGSEPTPTRPSLFNTLIQLKAHEEEKVTVCRLECQTEVNVEQVSCGSLYLHLKESDLETDSCCELLDKTADRATNTSILTVILSLLMLIPIAMASIGVKHLEDCPVQPKIPIYLLVGGCFGFLKLLSLLWQQVKFRRYKTIDDVDYDAEDEESGVIISKSSRCSEFVLSGFLLAWFLCGNYWVLGIWKPHFNQLLNEPSNWCDKTVYLFAFVQIIVCYAVLATGILLTILLSICQRIVSSK